MTKILSLNKSILSHKIVCKEVGQRPSASLLWSVSGKSSGNRKKGWTEKHCRGRIAELGHAHGSWWMMYQRLNSPWLHNELSSPSPETDATWRKDHINGHIFLFHEKHRCVIDMEGEYENQGHMPHGVQSKEDQMYILRILCSANCSERGNV